MHDRSTSLYAQNLFPPKYPTHQRLFAQKIIISRGSQSIEEARMMALHARMMALHSFRTNSLFLPKESYD